MPGTLEIPSQQPPITLRNMWQPQIDPARAEQQQSTSPILEDPVFAVTSAMAAGLPSIAGMFTNLLQQGMIGVGLGSMPDIGDRTGSMMPSTGELPGLAAPEGSLPMGLPAIPPGWGKVTGDIATKSAYESVTSPLSTASRETGWLPGGGSTEAFKPSELKGTDHPAKNEITLDQFLHPNKLEEEHPFHEKWYIQDRGRPGKYWEGESPDVAKVLGRDPIVKENLYTPDVRRESETSRRVMKHGYKTDRLDKTGELYKSELADSLDIPAPAYPVLDPDVMKRFGVPAEMPRPEELLWHGPTLGGGPQSSADQIREIQRSYGLSQGWFANEPNQPFGPFFLGVHKDDLPPLNVRERWLPVDPKHEIIPKWSPTDHPAVTASGRDVPPISVHPSKVHVIDQPGGHYYGTMGDYRPGLPYGTDRPMVPKVSTIPGKKMEMKGLRNEKAAIEDAIAELKGHISRTSPTHEDYDYYVHMLKENENQLEDLMAASKAFSESPMAPLKNYPTQHLSISDMLKLLTRTAEEAE